MAELERASKRARGDAGAENAPESAPTAAVSATGGAALGFVAPDAGNASESPPAVAASSSGASEISALGSGSGRASESSPAHAAAGAPAAGNGHLARVSRRFRPLTKEPSLWQQIVLSKLNSSALKGLQQLPGETRDSIRSLTVRICSLSINGFRTLFRAFGSQLQELRVGFHEQTSIPFSSLPLLQHYSSLRSLRLSIAFKRLESNAARISSPVVQDSLALLDALSFERLNLELKLICSESVLRRLSEPLESLKSLRDVTIVRNTMLDPDVIVSDVWFPVALLKHIGSDLPSLKKLCINNFPLRFPDSLRALSSLRRLEKLELLNWAAKSLDAEAREFLRSALPDTKVVFRDDVPPIQ
eukprot:tig00020951_g16445.t1